MLKESAPWDSSEQLFEDAWGKPSRILQMAYPPRGQTTCESVEGPPSDIEFYEKYVSRGRPVIFRGAAKEWSAVSKGLWSLKYLSDRVGNERVKVYASPTRDFEAPTTMRNVRSWYARAKIDRSVYEAADASIEDEQNVIMRPAETELTFREYVYLTTNYSNPENAVFYLQKHPLAKWRKSGVLKDLKPSIYFDHRSRVGLRSVGKTAGSWARFLALENWLLWIGRNVSRGNLHYDANENIHALIRGSKTFELFHPFCRGMHEELSSNFRSAHFLYSWRNNSKGGSGHFWSIPVSATPTGYQPFSSVNTTHPDPSKHPEFNILGTWYLIKIFVNTELRHLLITSCRTTTEKLSCRVNPGDMIYIPSYW